jgi:AhpD family alkylhydroperoxidase
MKEIEFINKRFNPDLIEFHDIAKQMAKAVGYSANLSIEKELAQLLRLRVAQLNECAYCIILHTKKAREIGIEPSKVDNISSWYNSELFSKKEIVALEYCDELNKGVSKNFQIYHDNLSIYFNEKEIAQIAAIIINMNVWTRLKLAQGATPNYK